MFGAIFIQEMLTAGRRQLAYFLRWLYAAVLLVQLGPRVLISVWHEWQRPGSSSLAVYAEFFDHAFATQHFLVLLILTPALAAGAITDEKLRGTLDYLLTTCLHPAEIVLGKLFARTLQVLVLALVTLPLVCFFGVIVDLPLANIVNLVLASAVVISAVASLSLLASVWCPRTRDAVLVTYLVLFVGYCLAEAAQRAGWDGPACAWSLPYAIRRDSPDSPEVRLLRLAAAWLLPALVCLALAAWRLRPAYAKLRQGTRTGWVGWRLPPLSDDENPVRWRERSLHGIAPLARLRAIPLWVAVPVWSLCTTAGLVALVWCYLATRFDPIAVFQNEGLIGLHLALRLSGVDAWTVGGIHASVTLFVLTLLLIVRASGAITDERERGAWDALLLTPLTSAEIVRGKFWGLLRAYAPYAVAYAVPTLPLAFLLGAEAFVVSTLAVGTLILAPPFITAMGLFCSARLSSGWRSLLATFAACYASLLVSLMLGLSACAFGCMVGALASVLKPILEDVIANPDVLIGGLAGVFAMLVLNGLIMMPVAYSLVQATEAYIDRTERARVSRLEHKQQILLQLADDLQREASV